YLTGLGVPGSRITEVNTGNDTLTSLQAAARVLRQHGWGSAVLVSDPWHMFRAKTMARDSGIDAWTSPTHSGPAVQTRTTQFRYIARETFALLYYRVTRAPADDVGTGLG
ncbi:MAG TPA: YdcF family protein, partial [Pseudonocardiaceae bacterium]